MIPDEVKLPKVTMEIFSADVVIDTHDAALHQGERAFRRIRMNVSANVLFGAVADRFVPAVILRSDALVGEKIISDEPRLRVYYFPNRVLQRLSGHVRHNATANLALSL